MVTSTFDPGGASLILVAPFVRGRELPVTTTWVSRPRFALPAFVLRLEADGECRDLAAAFAFLRGAMRTPCHHSPKGCRLSPVEPGCQFAAAACAPMIAAAVCTDFRSLQMRSIYARRHRRFGIGTWLSFNKKGSLVVAIEGDPRLLNRYDVIELNPQRHAGAKLTAARVFADWLVSSEGQQAIGAYQVNGQKLFNPSAGSPK